MTYTIIKLVVFHGRSVWRHKIHVGTKGLSISGHNKSYNPTVRTNTLPHTQPTMGLFEKVIRNVLICLLWYVIFLLHLSANDLFCCWSVSKQPHKLQFSLSDTRASSDDSGAKKRAACALIRLRFQYHIIWRLNRLHLLISCKRHIPPIYNAFVTVWTR